MARRVRRGLANFGEGLMRASQFVLSDDLMSKRQAKENQAQLFQSVVGNALAAQREREQQELIAQREAENDTRDQSIAQMADLLEGVLNPQNKAAVPTNEGIMSALTSMPGGMKDLNQFNRLVPAAASQRDKFSLQDEQAMNQAIATDQGKTFATGMAQNQIANETQADAMKRLAEKGGVETSTRTNLERQLNPILASREASQAQARFNVEFSPANLAAKLDFVRQEGLAKASMERDVTKMQEVDKQVKALQSIAPDLQRIQDLSKSVNKYKAGSVGRLAMAAGSTTQMVPQATELDRLSRSTAMRLVNDFFGNRGATSENDVNSVVARLPSSGDSEEVAQTMLTNFNKTLYEAMQVFANTPTTGDPMQRVNAGRKAMGLPEIDNQGNPIGGAPTSRDELIRGLEQRRGR